MTQRFEIGKREAITLLGHEEHIPMRSPDGTKTRKFSRRRAMAKIFKAASLIYWHDSIDGNIVMITDNKGVEWLFDAQGIANWKG